MVGCGRAWCPMGYLTSRRAFERSSLGLEDHHVIDPGTPKPATASSGRLPKELRRGPVSPFFRIDVCMYRSIYLFVCLSIYLILVEVPFVSQGSLLWYVASVIMSSCGTDTSVAMVTNNRQHGSCEAEKRIHTYLYICICICVHIYTRVYRYTYT